MSTNGDSPIYGNMAQLMAKAKGFSPMWIFIFSHLRALLLTIFILISQYLTFLLCGPSYVLLYNSNTYYIAYMELIFLPCVGYHMSCKMSYFTETLTHPDYMDDSSLLCG